MSYQVRVKNSAKEDLRKIRNSHLKEAFDKIIDTLKCDPYTPTQSFEKLQPKLQGRYSRRINHQHRVVYTVDEAEKIVSIYSAWTHYE